MGSFKKLLYHSSGGQKSGIKVSTGMAPSGGCEGESIPYLSPGFWWPLAILGIPWLVDTLSQHLPPSSHGLSLCVSVSQISTEFTAYPKPGIISS